MKKVFLFIPCILLAAGCTNESWTGFYYPNKSDLTVYTESPELETIEACRNWVDNQIPEHALEANSYDYECGKNCKFKSNLRTNVCEVTIR
jgi:hypothetical protein